MPLELIRNDITKVKCDAIVNAANVSLLGGGGVDGAIHAAAGPELLEECRTLGGCRTGDAKITGAYRLPCRYVIHTVGPIWDGGKNGEKALLRDCYRRSLELAVENRCESVAFPLISTGAYGYPKEEALGVAVETITAFLKQHELRVMLVVFDKASFAVSSELLSDVTAYIDDNYVDARVAFNRSPMGASRMLTPTKSAAEEAALFDMDEGLCETCAVPPELNEQLSRLDESFSEMLLRKIDEAGITDAECYKKANIDRRLFSKIKSDRLYKPRKATAVAFAVALQLSPGETDELLEKAGYALSRSNKFDVIVAYFIFNGIYNIFEINEVLFAFDQPLLGA